MCLFKKQYLNQFIIKYGYFKKDLVKRNNSVILS